MSRYSVPPSPIGVNLHVWANNLVEYLNDALGDSSENLPNTVLLPHLMDAYRQSAAQDGILMYDPAIETPVFSKDKDWLGFVTTDANGDTTLPGDLTVNGQFYSIADPSWINFYEPSTDTAGRVGVSSGTLWIQSGEAGQGASPSSGVIRFSGYSASDVSEFVVRHNGAYEPIFHGGKSTGFDTFLKLNGGGNSTTLFSTAPSNSSSDYALIAEKLDGTGIVRARADGQLILDTTPSNTTAAAANVQIGSGGFLRMSTSSGQHKSNYRPIGSPENIIEKLNPIRYHSELDGRDFIGFEMENVGAAMPEAAYDGNYDVRAIVAVVVDVLKNMLVKEAMK